MTPRYYDDCHPTRPDRTTWTLPQVLAERARERPDQVFLELPWADATFTYAETADAADRIGRAFVAAGGGLGDRVVIMAPNSAEYVLAWFGLACAGMVEVPLNTAYEGAFLHHQVATTSPKFAIVDAALAPRFMEDHAAFATIERLYVLGDDAEGAMVQRLRSAGHDGRPFAELLQGADAELPTPDYRDLAAIFFTSGTTGLSKGVMMSHSHLTFFAEQTMAMTRFTAADTYMAVGPLFHGNAQFMASYPALIAPPDGSTRSATAASPSPT
jgi:crotonobetaine/carnitine-CoA ligase